MSTTTTTTSTSTSPAKNEYLVHIPDHTDPETLSRRLAARPLHLKALPPLLESGRILFGGATLEEAEAENTQPDEQTPAGAGGGPGGLRMTGSVMLVRAESEDEVRRLVRGDVYAQHGVWDVEGMRVWRFRTAVRRGVPVGEEPWGGGR